MKARLLLIASAAVLSCGGPEQAAQDPSGRWEGFISISGQTLDIAVEIEGPADSLSASIDIPAQGAMGLGLDCLWMEGDSIGFSLPSFLGTAGFKGVMAGDSISGSFIQGGQAGTFLLRRAFDGDRPYSSRDVEFESEGWTYSGTITMPPGEGPFPGVVLLSGSGVQGRDEFVAGFGVLGAIADSLSCNGVAVLRCDDRGFGASPVAALYNTYRVQAADARAMLRVLDAEEGVDTSRTGFLGHSEGSTVALIAAFDSTSGADFVICLAGPAVPGYDLLLEQIGDISRLAGEDEESIQALVEAQRDMMDAVIAGDSGAAALDSILESQIRTQVGSLSGEELAAIGDVENYVAATLMQIRTTAESPWFREFITTDPAEYAAACRCPILAVYCSLDVQVDADQNAPVMAEALAGNEASAVEVLVGANHLFQSANTGSIEEYALLGQRFVPGLIPLLLSRIPRAGE